MMSERQHEIPSFPEPLAVDEDGDTVRIRLPEGPVVEFRPVVAPTLTLRVAEKLSRDGAAGAPILVIYERATTDARAALRAAEISYAGHDGRLYLRAPGLLVEHDDRRRPMRRAWEPAAELGEGTRNPFAKRSSRVPRALLLHHTDPMSVSELARITQLHPALVSRVVRALEDDAMVREEPVAGRRRAVVVHRPLRLLEAWIVPWQRRRIRVDRWDVGANDVAEALDMLRGVGCLEPNRWALGGLAGAATLRRVTEPRDVLVWTSPDGLLELGDRLQPISARRSMGVIRAAVAPDPWTLSLAAEADGLPVADPVQLWLDCSSEGERALEAAQAVAELAQWT